jgi:hypothetical protein
MTLEEGQTPSPMVAMYQALRARHPKWDVEIGQPRGPGWIPGTAWLTATEGPFQALLARTGERLQTADRRTIAASFALRYGWSSGVAMAPYLLYSCVPKTTLDNVSFKFVASQMQPQFYPVTYQRVAYVYHRGRVAGGTVESLPGAGITCSPPQVACPPSRWWAFRPHRGVTGPL